MCCAPAPATLPQREAVAGSTRAALVLLGYQLEKGAVLAYQRDARFTGRDLDDIPGPRTRAAMHGDLRALGRLFYVEGSHGSVLIGRFGTERSSPRVELEAWKLASAILWGDHSPAIPAPV